MKIALAMIVKGTEEEAVMLNQCLENVAKYVDGIFLTVTQQCEAVNKIGEMYGAQMSFYNWDYSFANARNHNFKQVPDDYTHILWLDTDDVVRGIEKLRGIIEKNPRVDAFAMQYLYSFDEHNTPVVVHLKTQVVKNGCVEWVGDLHEDFKPVRQLSTYLIEGIDRIHTSKHDRFEENKWRNLEVATKQLENDKKDPRNYWNLGNALKACGKNEKAYKAFQRFLGMSRSEEEKYIVRLRMAEIKWAMGKHSEGLEDAQYALGLRPEYPDAYHLLGSLYLEMQNYEQAKKMYLQGCQKKPPKYSIIVYNPRDYDYVPMMNLARLYVETHEPESALTCIEACSKIYPDDKRLKKGIDDMKKEVARYKEVYKTAKKLNRIKNDEKLKAKIAKLKPEIRSHPAITSLHNKRFIKTESTGRDIVFYCGYTTDEWHPEIAKTKGIGGSEEAVIWLSKLLVAKGWNVTVYNNCGREKKVFGDVIYKPYWEWNYRDKQDVVVLWRTPMPADFEINCDKVIVDLHDCVAPGEFTEERLKRISKIFVKSKFHQSLYPDVPQSKFVVVPNGIDNKVFRDTGFERDEKLLINTSSPDRSISALIKGLKLVKEEIPDVKCKWAYGWKIFDVVHGSDTKVMEWKSRMIKEMKEVGIEELGRISHEEVAKLYLTAGIFAYPSEFGEIDCISLSKSQAAGAYPITTDFSALGEKQDHGAFVHSKKTKDNWVGPYQHDFAIQDEKMIRDWADKVIWRIKNPMTKAERDRMRVWALDKFDWNKIANIWHNQLK